VPDLNVPVLIVGGGPVGLMLSMELASRGIANLLVNDADTPSTHPKGNSLNCRTMEHLRRLGIADEIRQTGLYPEHPTDVVYLTRFTGHELARLNMPAGKSKIDNPGPWGDTLLTPEPMHRSNQFYFEPLFKTHAESCANSDVRFGWQLTSFEDFEDRVEAEIEELSTGKTVSVRCNYLVGCDGSRSIVRRQLGYHFSGRTSSGGDFYDGDMISAYFSAPGVYDALAMPIGWKYYTINNDIRTDCITLDGKGEFMMLAEMPEGETIDSIDVVNIFRGAVGADIEVELKSSVAWLAGLAMTADGYQRGRVLLAGDSVHLFTPAGGFGFNTGIDDAVNIAWKIAATLHGWGGPKLVETYEIERRPIGIRNTNESGRLTAQVGSLNFPTNIEDGDDAGAGARLAFKDKLYIFKEEFASIGIQLGARYDSSPIVVGDGSTPPPDEAAVYRPTACPGGRAPHYWMEERSSLFDQVGSWFTVLRLGATAPAVDGLVAAAESAGIPIKVLNAGEDAARDLYERDLAIIRPDQHVAWRANETPDDPAALWATITGH
jgi:2-polyprenyl-6-methoxyphenol hydroxylase-like FAD-dependent oxidoreductase